jgi:hypothetical protein
MVVVVFPPLAVVVVVTGDTEEVVSPPPEIVVVVTGDTEEVVSPPPEIVVVVVLLPLTVMGTSKNSFF